MTILKVYWYSKQSGGTQRFTQGTCIVLYAFFILLFTGFCGLTGFRGLTIRKAQ